MKKFLKNMLERQPRLVKASLRAKLILVFILPMIVVLSLTSIVHSVREWDELRKISEHEAVQLAEFTLKGLRHAMLENNSQMAASIIKSYGNQDQVERIWLINNDGRVIYSTQKSDVGNLVQRDEYGCQECHQNSPETRSKATRLVSEEGLLRTAAPINNDKECQACHSSQDAHLGVLLVDKSLVNIEKQLYTEVTFNILISIFSLVVVAVIAYLMINWLVERRIVMISDAISKYAAGDFSTRIQKIWRTEDELTQLAGQFNKMAQEIERHSQERIESAMVRQKAIIDERERIARELHDSLPQLLAYFIAKIGAIRLLINQGKVHESTENLNQLEDSSRRLFSDVREAIIGLRMSRRIVEGLVPTVKSYIEQFTQFCGLPVEFHANSGVLHLHLDPETQIHALRIVQEALSNIRKHANATKAQVTLTLQDQRLVITIQDNGSGFDLEQRFENSSLHFGLHTMRERAESVGGKFELVSKLGEGTLISVTLNVHELEEQ